jgi:L-serine dehydratase
MESIKELFRIGVGPSSSHTMAPRFAAKRFRDIHPETATFRVTLYGSLAATGKGHLTDVAIKEVFDPKPTEIIWKESEQLPMHPNGMLFEALNEENRVKDSWKIYSVGGGALLEEGCELTKKPVYDLTTMTEIMEMCQKTGRTYWEYVNECEGDEIWDFLEEVWVTMKEAINRGLNTEGILPGGLGLARKACQVHARVHMLRQDFRRNGFIWAYAFAVAEENAAGGKVVTAPTCGSSGIVPAVIRYVEETEKLEKRRILQGLATAGLIGNIIKTNASISGAEVGCQGEVGSACAMAAGAVAQLFGGSVQQIEYAAEMALEHHLGLTCDPVQGLVQIPCIERNTHAATRALACAMMSTHFSDGKHLVPFDSIVTVVKNTGHDLPSLYRETSKGGMAKQWIVEKEKD